MVEYDVEYMVDYRGEQRVSGNNNSFHKKVTLTVGDEKNENLRETIGKKIAAYIAGINEFPNDWVNVSVISAVRSA
ncbi:MAG: hypothetical protein IJ215_05090 [Clostridia bacterium]|nr:hypothetical protein [Clostridia bacterium]